MLWICRPHSAVTVKTVVTNLAVSGFWLFKRESPSVLREVDHRIDPGGANRIDADAHFRIPADEAEGTYEIRCVPAVMGGAGRIGWQLEVQQNFETVQALDIRGQPMNGARAPFHHVKLKNPVPAEMSIDSFSISFE